MQPKIPQIPPEELDGLIEALELSAEDARWLRDLIDSFDPAHGVRAILVQDVRPSVALYCAEQLPAYDAYAAHLPQAPPFSFLPLTANVLATARAATLHSPDQALLEASRRWTLLGMERFAQNPLFLTTRRAGTGLGEYLAISAGATNPYTNFGRAEARRLGPGHYEVDHVDSYADWGLLSFAGYYEGLFAIFEEPEGQVTLERINAQRLIATLRW